MRAPIVEIFETIQGEGPNIGVPSIFIRFWGCNLRCQFAGIECDTPYAVYKEKDKALMMTVETLVEKIKALKPSNIIFTGGEPTLYETYILKVIDLLNEGDKKYTYDLETNGSRAISSEFAKAVTHFSVSVKLKSSNQLNESFDKRRINPEALESFKDADKVFKFVISSDEDLIEIKQLTNLYKDWPVFLMPEGVTRKAVVENSQRVVDLCIENNWTFCPREHIIIWDKQRGV